MSKIYHVDKKPLQNFYDWCMRKNPTILDRWDYDKNVKSPKEIRNLHRGLYWFKCGKGIHESELRDIGNIVKAQSVPQCTICNSFGTWCEQHSRLDLLKRWDYEKNGDVDPYHISRRTGKSYWFKCPRGIHPSELKNICNLVKQYGTSLCKQCNSIGQWGIDNVDIDFIKKYWSDKNTKNPFHIGYQSPQKIWIKCQETDYHPDYDISCVAFSKGERCPYCAKKRITKEDSLGFKYPQSFDYWVEKKTTPYDYFPLSNKSVYWKCDIHGTYKRKICDMVESDFRCPQCKKWLTESKLQHKVDVYISEKYKDVRHENNCTIVPINPNTNYPLPFDNEIVELKLIIQVNGAQHYSSEPFKAIFDDKIHTPEEQLKYRQYLDSYKKEYALSHGYHYLEIPYWTDNKKETWKKLIDRKIEQIK